MENKAQGTGSAYTGGTTATGSAHATSPPQAAESGEVAPIPKGQSSSVEPVGTSASGSPPEYTPDPPQKHHLKKVLRTTGIVTLTLLLIGGAVFGIEYFRSGNDANQQNASKQFDNVQVPLQELISQDGVSVLGSRSLIINGQLRANDGFVLDPGDAPEAPEAGQIYFDEESGELAYYNGDSFIFVSETEDTPEGVSSLDGTTGDVTTGTGLQLVGGTLSNSGVLSFQGQTGNVTLTGGTGIDVDGSTVTNTGDLTVGNEISDVVAGGGLVRVGAGTTVNPYQVALQSCPNGQILQSTGGGNWACDIDDGSSASYMAGDGLQLIGNVFSVNSPTCAGTDKLQWNGSAFVCAADVDTDTTYTAGTGLNLVGTTFNNSGVLDVSGSGAVQSSGGQNPTLSFVDGGSAGDVWQWDGDSWELATLGGGGDNAVGNEITDVTGANSGLVRSGAGTSGDPYTLAVNAGDGLQLSGGEVLINSPTCAGTDKLQWTGTAFQCAADVDTDTTYTAGTGLNLVGTQFNNTGILTVSGDSEAIQITAGQNPIVSFVDGTVDGQIWQWNDSLGQWELDTIATSNDDVIGNEVTDVTSGTSGLSRSGSGTGGDPYTLGLVDCSNTEVLQSGGAGVWGCAPASGVGTSYGTITNGGLRLVGNDFGLQVCANGELLQAQATSGEWGCVAAGGVGTSYTAGDGLQLGGNEFSVSSPTCAGTDKLQWTGSAFVCSADVDTDTDTTYTAGTGLNLVGTQFNNSGVLTVSTSGALQSTGGQNPTIAFDDGVSTGQIWQWDGASWVLVDIASAGGDGVVGNEVTDVTGVNSGLVRSGTGTGGDPYTLAVNPGDGLQLSGGALLVDSPTCAGTDKLQWTGTAFQCAADVDTDTDTTYGTIANGGLRLSGTDFGLAICSDGEVLKAQPTSGEWACGTDNDGAGTVTLQNAYDNGNTITTTDGRDISFTLADTTTDSDFLVDLAGTGNVFQIQDNGTGVFTVADGGLTTIQTSTGNDSTTAFQVLDADGGSPVFNVDTENELVGIGTNAPSRTLDVRGEGIFQGGPTSSFDLTVENTNNASTSSHAKLELRSAGSTGGDAVTQFTVDGATDWAIGVDNSDSDAFKISQSFNLGSNDVFSLTSDDGAATFQNTSDSAAAFQILNTGDDVLFNTNTANNHIKIGNNTGTDTATTQLVLDSATSDPTTNLVNGAMYYNSTDDQFRCYQGGTWIDCVDATGGAVTLQNAYDNGNTITTSDGRNIEFTLADTTTDSDFLVNLAGTGNVLQVQDGGTGVFTVADGGLTTIQTSTGNDSTTAFQVLDADGGSPILNVDTVNERVGIGTDTPTARLEISDASGGSLLRLNGAGGTAQMYLSDAGDLNDEFVLAVGSEHFIFSDSGLFGINSISSSAQPDASLDIIKNGSYDYLHIGTGDNTNGDVFKIDNTGRVGIGTTQPEGALDVLGSTIVRDNGSGGISRTQSVVDEGSPASATFSATPTEGNLLVATALERDGTAASGFSISGSGWTQRVAHEAELADANARRTLLVWTKIAGPSEPANVQVSGGATTKLMLQEFSGGANSSWTFEAVSSNDTGTGDSSPLSTGSTGSVPAGDLLLLGISGWRNEDDPINNVAWASSTLANALHDEGGDNGRTINSAYALETTGGTKSSSVSWTSTTPGSEATAALLAFSTSSSGGTFQVLNDTGDNLVNVSGLNSNVTFGGSSNIVREFDGTDDDLVTSTGSLSGMTHGTVAAIFKMDTYAGDPKTIFTVHDSGNSSGYYLAVRNDNALRFGNGTTGTSSAADLTQTDRYYLAVVRKGTGSTAPRFSVYDFVTDTWSHSSGGSLGDAPAPGADGTVNFTEGGNEWFNGRVAARAAWSNSLGPADAWTADASGDSAIEAAGLESALGNWASASPDALWAFNQETTGEAVLDLTGNGADQTSVTGTTVINSDAPAGFNFSHQNVDLSVNGAFVTQNTADSATAFSVLNAASDTLFTANTSLNQIKIGDSTGTDTDTTQLVLDSAASDPTTNVTVGAMYYNTGSNEFRCYFGGGTGWANCGGTSGGVNFQQGGNSFGATGTLGTNDTFGMDFITDGNTVASLSTTGQATFQNSTDDDNAFRVLDANGNDVFNIGTGATVTQGFEGVTFPPTSPGTWTTGGDVSWSRDTDDFSEGSASAVSGNITDSQDSWLDLDIDLATESTLTFDWQVSSEVTFDYLVVCVNNDTSCSINGGYHTRISGSTSWTEVNIPLPSGSNSIRWLYGKDSGATSGSDEGWVDNVRIKDGAHSLDIDALATFQSSTNAAQAFRVLNAAGESFMNVDTLNNNVTFGQAAGTEAKLVSAKDYALGGGNPNLDLGFAPEAGDRVIVVIGSRFGLEDGGAGNSQFVNSEWQLIDETGYTQVAYRDYTSAGSSAVDLDWGETTGTNTKGAQVFRINDHSPDIAPEATSVDTDGFGSNSYTAPSLSPTWGEANNLWLSTLRYRATENVTSYPSPDNQQQFSIGQDTELSRSTEVVSTDTLPSDTWQLSDFTDSSGGQTHTIAIAPGHASVTALGRLIAQNNSNFSSAFTVLGADGDTVLDAGSNGTHLRSQGFEDATFVPTSPGTWTTGGDANWARDTGDFSEGSASAVSGSIGDDQDSWLDLDVNLATAGSVTFDWQVSSEEDFDYLVVCVDDDSCSTTYAAISGTVSWTEVSIPLDAGSHSIRWMYTKDGGTIGGSDEGWVDNVRITDRRNNLTVNGAATFQNETDSVDAFRILNVASDSLVNVDTLNDEVTFGGHVLPGTDDTYDLGSSTQRWRDLYLGPASLHIGTDGDEGVISYNTTTDEFEFDKSFIVNGDATVNGGGIPASGLGDNWTALGSLGCGSGQFANPLGLDVDSDNNKVFVADWDCTRVDRFDSGGGGTTLGQNWQTYSGSFSGDDTIDVAVDSVNNKLYVILDNSDLIVRFDSGGGGTTFGANQEDLAFSTSSSMGLAVDPGNNKLYVAGSGDNTIYRFDSGSGGTTFGANTETFTTGIDDPHGIAVDTQNNKVYAVNQDDSNVVRFDSGGGGTTFGANFESFGSSGSGTGQFNSPNDVAVDIANDRLFIADAGNSRIAQIDSGSGGAPLGSSWQEFGTNGSGVGQFSVEINGIAYDSATNKVFVSDWGGTGGSSGDRVVNFSAGSTGTAGSAFTVFNGLDTALLNVDTTTSDIAIGDGTSEISLNGDITSSGGLNLLAAATFQNTSDSTTAFQVLDADGGTPVLNVDTTNERVGIGTDAPSSALNIVQGGQGSEYGLTITESGGDYIQLYVSSGNENYLEFNETYTIGPTSVNNHDGTVQAGETLTLKTFEETFQGNINFDIGIHTVANIEGVSGAVYFQNHENSNQAFRILSDGGADTLFTADTTNNHIKIGNSTGTDTATTQLVLDSATSDPTTNLVAGATYYNTGSNEFRCYFGGGTGWANCGGTSGGLNFQQGGNSFGAIAILGTNDTNNLEIETDGTSRWVFDTSGHFTPNVDDTYDIGSSTNRVRDLYLGPNSLHIGTDGDEGVISYNTTTDELEFDKSFTVNGGATVNGGGIPASGFGDNWAELGDPGSMTDPYATAIDPVNNKFYIVDFTDDYVARMDSGGGGTTFGANYTTLGTTGTGTGQFSEPSGIAVDPDNNRVYVADSDNTRIASFDSGDGGTTFGANWNAYGTSGTGANDFSYPFGVAVDADTDTLYVSDPGNSRVSRFDAGTGGTTFGANRQNFGSNGPGSGQFDASLDVAIDTQANKMYVMDLGTGAGNDRVARFDSGGGGTTFGANWEAFGTPGSGSGQFDSAESIAIDTTNDELYVADENNNRIAKFDSGGGGTTLGANWDTFGTFGSGIGEFNQPDTLVLDTTTNTVYVLDYNNTRYVSFDGGISATTGSAFSVVNGVDTTLFNVDTTTGDITIGDGTGTITLDGTLVSPGDLTIDPTGGEVIVDGDVVPLVSGDTLGDASQVWLELYLDDDGSVVFGDSQEAALTYSDTNDRLEVTGADADLFIEDRLSLGIQDVVVANSGDANPAAFNLTPASSLIQITCNDISGGCAGTMVESSASEGDIAVIVNISTNPISFTESPGTLELTGASSYSMSNIYDNLTLIYIDSNWVELTRGNH